ncbi:MAG: nucleoside-diphosphate kinase [Candidatus Sungbacteria bacterium RIFCSPLOWO2_02_FULL_48_13b]|uniref:nucleoside-diphosphate kinase n=1 Tax=Candidatus Sungbacteria bacterium RIFCSPLOWO2_02_FULL_48_13b TaxID=1802283 RepID=A0A1G2LEH2_9BACT|nr:MAG: nucleoside-diphosphate kinase [Candidatus Sungbacteria bacterium RIFCSPLOWO2_02_FULL_48_13b]
MQKLTEEKTFVIVKPDGVKRGLVGEVIRRIEQRGLKIIALEMIWATRPEIDRHYPKNKAWVTGLGNNTLKTYNEFKIPVDIKKEYGTTDPYKIGLKVRGWLLDFMTEGPVVKIAIEGVHAIRMVRKIVGQTIPAFAEMGTIRGDYSIDSPALANANKRALRNLIHASGNPAEAKNELRLWFKKNQIHSYKRSEEDAMF